MFPATFDFGAAAVQPQQQPLYQQAAAAPPFPRLAPPKNGFPATSTGALRTKSVLGSVDTLIPAQTDAEYVAGLERHLDKLEREKAQKHMEREEAARPSAPLLSNRDEDDDEAEHDFGAGFEAEIMAREEERAPQPSDGDDDDEDGGCKCCG
jgi:hypothetical protein